MPDELTIGELSTRSGIAPSALRFYETQRLIAAQRTSGNQRRYDRSTLRRIALIQAGRAAGIPLEQIRAALETLPTHHTPTRRDWERLSRTWRNDLDHRITTLQAVRNRLTTCIGCGCLSIDRCTLLNPDDEAAKLGPGAHYLKRDSSRTPNRLSNSSQRAPHDKTDPVLNVTPEVDGEAEVPSVHALAAAAARNETTTPNSHAGAEAPLERSRASTPSAPLTPHQSDSLTASGLG